jgi:hypothetical protein
VQRFVKTVDLEQVYHTSAPQLNFSDTTWRSAQDLHLYHVMTFVVKIAVLSLVLSSYLYYCLYEIKGTTPLTGEIGGET